MGRGLRQLHAKILDRIDAVIQQMQHALAADGEQTDHLLRVGEPKGPAIAQRLSNFSSKIRGVRRRLLLEYGRAGGAPRVDAWQRRLTYQNQHGGRRGRPTLATENVER